MHLTNTLAFLVFPYMMLTLFVFGHAYRYVTDRYQWTARSNQFLEKENLFYGATIFHWGIIGTLLGHAGGMLIPQTVYDSVGIDAHMHEMIAYLAGILVGNLAFIGCVLLFVRRIISSRVRAATTVKDYVLLLGLLLVTGTGVVNVLTGHCDVLNTIAPWIRSIVIFAPRPDLMLEVPIGYKIHVIAAFALFGYSPFTRLVHIWSAPFIYFFRGHILFRRRVPV